MSQKERETFLFSFALDVSLGKNLQKSKVKAKTVDLYVAAAASFATDALLPDPRFRECDLGKSRVPKFPLLQQLLTTMSKWEGEKRKCFSLSSEILLALQKIAKAHPLHSLEHCAVDAIALGVWTGSRCSEYCPCNGCKGTTEPYSLVPTLPYTREFAGQPIALIPEDFSFLSASKRFVRWKCAQKSAENVTIRFRFDKAGNGNVNRRTFRRHPDDSFFCPVRTSFRILTRWLLCSGKGFTPAFVFRPPSPSYRCFLNDQMVNKMLRYATEQAYPEDDHIFRINIQKISTHSIRVFACCLLAAANLSEAQIEFRLRWKSDCWKEYLRESLSEVDETSQKLFPHIASPPNLDD